MGNRGSQVISKSIELSDIDDTNAHLFELASDRYGGLMWDQGSVPAEDAEPGEELTKTWEDFGGGMGETYDLEERIGFKTGAYYFSKNCQVSNPFRIRPRQQTTSVTLTNSAAPVTHFFEATDANAADKYIYCEAEQYIFKVNANGTLKETIDANANSVCGQPAEWNSQWEVPVGDTNDWIALTTCNDEVNNAGGDDAFTERTDLKATHFTVVENELVRAYSSRTVAKCSHSNCADSGNWAGAYNVGSPATVITHLLNIGGECGVGTRDGFYLWDTVSQTRQQLPLLGGVTDTENAKGAKVVGNLVLIPTVDGLWRWCAGGGVPIGPDANDGYVEVKGPSNLPIKLKHYDSVFLGRYIYNACYDGTNYHIIYTRLNLNDPTLARAKWDFLFSTATAIKALYIDTNRKLWFSHGNNIAYITLSRGGKPEGGGWGQLSSGGLFYLPTTKMKTEALKRLRLVEIDLERGDTNFNWTCAVYRDGAATENVGSALTSGGVGECFWTAGTNDTAREILLYVYWLTDANFNANSVVAGIKRITLHAEALEEDADLIVCSVQLGEKAKEQKAIIDRHLNAGVLKATNALSGVKETVVLYRRRYHSLEQRGNEPPISACELRFRRSDTS